MSTFINFNNPNKYNFKIVFNSHKNSIKALNSSSISNTSSDDYLSDSLKTFYNIFNENSIGYTSSELKDCINSFSTKGKNDVFKTTISENSDGETTTKYNMSKIKTLVSKFIDKYNSFVDSSSTSEDIDISNKAKSIFSLVKSNRKSFEKIGIELNSNNKLSLDTSIFAKADGDDIKTLFVGNKSIGNRIAVRSNYVYKAAITSVFNSNNLSNAQIIDFKI